LRQQQAQAVAIHEPNRAPPSRRPANFHQIVVREFSGIAAGGDQNIAGSLEYTRPPVRAGERQTAGRIACRSKENFDKTGDKTMLAKSVPVLVLALLLGTTALASAQALVLPSYGYAYGYAYVPVYPPAVTYGLAVTPQYAVAPQYYVPGYYAYAPAYSGWSGARWNW
jgi:hypothetical protein